MTDYSETCKKVPYILNKKLHSELLSKQGKIKFLNKVDYLAWSGQTEVLDKFIEHFKAYDNL